MLLLIGLKAQKRRSVCITFKHKNRNKVAPEIAPRPHLGGVSLVFHLCASVAPLLLCAVPHPNSVVPKPTHHAVSRYLNHRVHGLFDALQVHIDQSERDFVRKYVVNKPRPTFKRAGFLASKTSTK